MNAKGGAAKAEVDYKIVDDAYNPAQTVQAVRRLVEQDQVFAVFNTLGTESNLAIRDYLNQVKVPQLFAASGATTWGRDAAKYLWTIGFQPSYAAEGWLYGVRREDAEAGEDRGPLPERRLTGKGTTSAVQQGQLQRWTKGRSRSRTQGYWASRTSTSRSDASASPRARTRCSPVLRLREEPAASHPGGLLRTPERYTIDDRQHLDCDSWAPRHLDDETAELDQPHGPGDAHSMTYRLAIASFVAGWAKGPQDGKVTSGSRRDGRPPRLRSSSASPWTWAPMSRSMVLNATCSDDRSAPVEGASGASAASASGRGRRGSGTGIASVASFAVSYDECARARSTYARAVASAVADLELGAPRRSRSCSRRRAGCAHVRSSRTRRRSSSR